MEGSDELTLPVADARCDLLAFASTCTAFRQAAIPFFEFSVKLEGPTAVVRLAKVFGRKAQSLVSVAQGIQVLTLE